MICQVIKSQRDPFLKEMDLSLLEMCAKPSNLKKEDLPQWMFIDLIDPLSIRRNLTNYKNCYAIIIEFDNKEGEYLSIEAFASKYSHLAWILHTTSSHTKDKHKYRVILPLDEPTPYAIWHDYDVREIMKEYFKGVDPSSFSNFQKIPALPANPEDYYYHVNKGARFSFLYIRDHVNKLRFDNEQKHKLSRPIREDGIPSAINYEAYKAKVVSSIEDKYAGCGTAETGHRYTDLTSYCGKLLSAKYPDGYYVFDDHEVMHIIKSECKDPAVIKMVKSLSRRRK